MKSHDEERSGIEGEKDLTQVADDVPTDVAERPGDTKVEHEHADELADEWGEESFPASDPPAHY